MIASSPSVLIIGGGPAGTGAIEQFTRKGFKVTVFEARPSIGGLWNFDPSPPECKITFDKDGHAIALSELEHLGRPAPAPTPMYAGVTANTPRDIMTYRSHPYPIGTDEFPTHKVIRQYQENFAQPYLQHFRFNRVVTRVRYPPPSHSCTKKWLVEWTPSVASLADEVEGAQEEGFDYVVVANGSDSRPYIPYFDGLWEWKGDIKHSRWYRKAEAYAGKTVMVVGAGPSSADIVRELGMLAVTSSPLKAKKIYRSVKPTNTLRYDTELEKGWKEHVQHVAPIKIFHGPSVESSTGRIVTFAGEVFDDVDAIIFATSFVIRMEFLRNTDAPFDKAPLLRYPAVPSDARKPPSEVVGASDLGGGHRVHNLDAHSIFFLPDPSLAFLLLHAEAIPWPFSEMQARVVAAYWSGTPLILEPHPQEDSESHSILVLGHPGEFDYAEKLLALIGEGGSEEVDTDGKWGAWPAYKKHLRALID